MDYQNVEAVKIQIVADARRIWVCVDGACVLRVRGIKTLELQDDRACLEGEGSAETARQRDELRVACEAALELPDICDEIGYGGDVDCIRDGHGMLKTADGEYVKAHTQGGFPARNRIVKMLRTAIANAKS